MKLKRSTSIPQIKTIASLLVFVFPLLAQLSSDGALGHYLTASQFCGPLAKYAGALQPELGGPGRERLIISGTMELGGSATPFVFTRELDRKLRIDVLGSSPRSFVFLGLGSGAPQFPSIVSDNDWSLVETLVDDSPEAFLYSQLGGTATRWLGGFYRADSSTAAGYTGPYYDVLVRSAEVHTLPGQPIRTKFFYFDSNSGLFAKCRYTIQRNGTEIDVEVDYENWTMAVTPPQPGLIVRKENGNTLFTLQVNAVQIAASTPDALLPTN